MRTWAPPNIDIDSNINRYCRDLQPKSRYASFDYCYNYFQCFRKNGRTADLADGEHLQQSCLQIGFFLASWGMLHNSFLLQKSIRFYEPLVDFIAAAPPELWQIDVDRYTDANIGLLLGCYGGIAAALEDGGDATPTLVTKIMLGVFGNVPAFDTNFVRGLRIYWRREESLRRVAKFYTRHKPEIDKHHLRTFDLAGGRTDEEYPRAKIIDMVGFIEGQ